MSRSSPVRYGEAAAAVDRASREAAPVRIPSGLVSAALQLVALAVAATWTIGEIHAQGRETKVGLTSIDARVTRIENKLDRSAQ
jgi:hypothetical protein